MGDIMRINRIGSPKGAGAPHGSRKPGIMKAGATPHGRPIGQAVSPGIGVKGLHGMADQGIDNGKAA